MISIATLGINIEAFSMLKAVVPIVFLFNAAIQDWRRRELDASAWAPMVIMGFFFLGLELASPFRVWNIVLKLITTLITLLIPYFLHLYELGDAVVVISLSLVHVSTTKPILGGFFLTTPFPDFGFTMLWNTELITLLLFLLKKVYKSALRKRLLTVGNTSSTRIEAVRENKGGKALFLKQELPLVSFLLPGYVLTILFGSIIPLPF